MPEYQVNLCTFMGRENNIKILHRYVEEALEIQAIDHYYMIDMTRCIEDHELLKQEKDRLNESYPNRVHIVNRDKRRKEIESGNVMDTVGSWAPFYKFCENFNDNDIIIKCDDDTLYIDVESLRDAARVRWETKEPFLMHANTINNGVCAFHQNLKNIWSFEGSDILNRYPTSGLTGPLFSHPDIACKCHEQFTSDLITDESNIEKYKLKKNPYFTARVSINTILMLGSDRKIISTIDTQDEYVSSCRIGQQLNRPNMIIGDFVTAHHTYGVQEPVMEELGTYEMYSKLADKMFGEKRTRENKKITSPNSTAKVLRSGNIYASRYWSNDNSVTIRNNRTNKYMNIDWIATERIKFIDKDTRVPTGVFWYKTELTASDKPLIFNIDQSAPGNLQIQNCTEVLKSEQPGTDANRFMSFPVKLWFQQNYNKQLVDIVKSDSGSYKIKSTPHPEYNLICDDRNPDKIFYFFSKEIEEEWTIEDMSHTNNMIVPIEINRGDQTKCENDPTTARVTNDESLPECRNFREFYWMVDGYIWEFVNVPGTEDIHVKLISDDIDDLYLGCNQPGDVVLTADPELWSFSDNKLTHVESTLKLSITKDGISTNKQGTEIL